MSDSLAVHDPAAAHDFPTQVRGRRFRSAGVALLVAVVAAPAVLPFAASAQTSPSSGPQNWSSTVVTWTNSSPPPGLILPGTIQTAPGGSASGPATSVIPVLAPATGSGSGAPISVPPLGSGAGGAGGSTSGSGTGSGTVVRVTAASIAPDALAVASRLALGALKDRRTLGSGVPTANAGVLPLLATASGSSPGSPGVNAQVTIVDGGGHSWQSTIVSTDAIEAAVAKATPATITDPEAHYAAARSQVATLVAPKLKLDPTLLDQVWARTDDRRMTALFAALAQVGTLYKYAGNTPGGFDCSGLTSYAWSVAGVKIPRISTDQINAAAPRLSTAELQPGDLVWRPGHVGMYVGLGDLMVHSPRAGKPVTVEKMGSVVRMGSPV